MRITGYRTLTTVQDWGRPVGDANGVFPDGVVTVHLVLVDTDEGITGVGIGSQIELSSIFAAIEGEDPRATSALYDRMLRQVVQGGARGCGLRDHRRPRHGAVGHQGARRPANRCGDCSVVGIEPLPAYASGLDIALTDEELAATYKTYAEHGVRAAKLKGGLDVDRDLARLDHRSRRSRRGATRASAGPDARRQRVVDAQAGGPTRRRSWSESVDLIWVEEPVRRWDAEGMVAVGRGIRASVASGENLTGLEQFRPLLAAGALDVVQTAAGWGVTHFLRVAALAHAYDLPVSPIGTHADRAGARGDRRAEPHRDASSRISSRRPG